MQLFHTKTKKILGILLVLVVTFVGVKAYESRKISRCLDDAMVWDYDEGRCRNDCLKWGESFGCIKLTPEETRQIAKCRYESDCLKDDMIRTICLRNEKAYNESSRNCKYDFKPELCHKLSGMWTYPSSCGE